MKNKYIKLFMLLTTVLLLSGCVHVNRDSIETITNYIVDNNIHSYNYNSRGYKMYIPRGLSVTYSSNLNKVIKSQAYDYYLYVDLVSYFNKENLEYKKEDNIYYSEYIKDNQGVINVSKKDNNYLVVVQYNYAKVETMVKEKDIKIAISNSLIMLSSIQYNEQVIKAMLDEGVLSLNERPVEVFKTKDSAGQNELIEIEDSEYIEEDSEKDRDYIN